MWHNLIIEPPKQMEAVHEEELFIILIMGRHD